MKGLGRSFNKFLLLWFGEFISAIGSGLTAFLPSFLFAPIAGVFADRYDRRLLMVLGDSLSASLFGAGLFMAGFGLRENTILICISGFLLFAMLPLANTSLDFLMRIHIKNELQGRAWGIIGIISQMGYIFSYALSGVLADYVFTPLLMEKGGLANSVGSLIGTGDGRGTGFLIIISGILLSIVSIVLYCLKSVKKLDTRGDLCTDQ